MRLRNLEVHTASSAATALDLVRGVRIDLAFVDYVLPEGNGVDLIAQLKTLRPACEAVLLSALASPTTFVQAGRAGAIDGFQKPVNFAALVDELEGSVVHNHRIPTLKVNERMFISRVVQASGGNRSLAAKRLKISRAKVYRVTPPRTHDQEEAVSRADRM